MSAFRLRTGTAADTAAVLALNNANEPAVNAIDAEYLAFLVRHAAFYHVAEDAEGLVGLVICLPPGTPYWSHNYQWFSERYDDFLYLDRVAVAERARRLGVGRTLYEEMHRSMQGHFARVALEVNLRPPNPVSDAFHRRLGYEPVAVREMEGGSYAVTMYVRPL